MDAPETLDPVHTAQPGHAACEAGCRAAAQEAAAATADESQRTEPDSPQLPGAAVGAQPAEPQPRSQPCGRVWHPAREAAALTLLLLLANWGLGAHGLVTSHQRLPSGTCLAAHLRRAAFRHLPSSTSARRCTCFCCETLLSGFVRVADHELQYTSLKPPLLLQLRCGGRGTTPCGAPQRSTTRC